MSKRALRFWPLLVVFLFSDCATKRLAEEHLSPPGTPREVAGNTVRLTLVYNDGGALGIDTGRTGQKLLILVSVAFLIGLGLFYRTLPHNASTRAIALALLIGGATGNLFDRVASELGVVDFIDLGLGSARFWTFNIADVGITFGAILLAWRLWNEQESGAASPTSS